jgi:hypothetical protein
MASNRSSVLAKLAVEQMQMNSLAATIAEDESAEEAVLSLMV